MSCSKREFSFSKAEQRAQLDRLYGQDNLLLIDEVNCANPKKRHDFTESETGLSKIKTLVLEDEKKTLRYVPNTVGQDAGFVAYKLGKGKNLQAGKAYVITVEYPDQAPRTNFIINRGGESVRGFSTGVALGDTLDGYTANNLESLNYPLTQRWQVWQQLFYLHEHFAGLKIGKNFDSRPFTPKDGFWLIVAHGHYSDAPLSAGIDLAKIRLYEVLDEQQLSQVIHYPHASLPRRHLFSREEMSDVAVHARGDYFSQNQPVTNDPLQWFENKAKVMKFLGMNTFAKDLLEWGFNQGFLSQDSNWYAEAGFRHADHSVMDLWKELLSMLKAYDHYVLPYYEYRGSQGLNQNGLGYQRRSEPLKRAPYDPEQAYNECRGYTPLPWVEMANADILDPTSLLDAKRLLEKTIVQHVQDPDLQSYLEQRLLGAWFRTRESHLPINFSDQARQKFRLHLGLINNISRKNLENNPKMLRFYRSWWKEEREKFFDALANYIHTETGINAKILLTAYGEEPGPKTVDRKGVATDNMQRFDNLTGIEVSQLLPQADLAQDYHHLITRPKAHEEQSTCDDLAIESSFASPRPRVHSQSEKTIQSYPFNRLFSVASEEQVNAFRSPAGMASIFHHPLNEDRLNDLTGYFVSDVERAGPHSILAEARALAFHDPQYLGYLSAHTFNRAYPQYAKKFNAAFLSLPAIPSFIDDAASSEQDVIVRVYPTENQGTYIAVINTHLDKLNVNIALPQHTLLVDLIKQETTAHTTNLNLNLHSGEVRTFYLNP
ncbi:MAG TPA: hypothetical protein PKC21_09735 [Oligoflexia bacterium]|nr:hypothetical protein [Oligoflexia bacterium]